MLAHVNPVEHDRTTDEINRQWDILWRERWERLVLSSIPYGLSVLFVPLWLVVCTATVNLLAEILHMHLLRLWVRHPTTSLYLASHLCVFILELAYAATAGAVWLSANPYAHPFAVGMVMSGLLHLAIVRAIHLPQGITGLAASFTAMQGTSLIFWWAGNGWPVLAVATLSICGATAYAMTAMISNNRLHRATAQGRTAARVADAAKARFLTQMSHELRTPLNAIIGLGTAEVRHATTSVSQERLRLMVSSAQGLTTVLDDILELSSINEGKLPIRPVVFDARAEIETATGLFAMQAKYLSIDLRLDFAAGFPQYVLADPQRLRQCLFNLISNALKHASGGHIALRACVDQGMVQALRIEIADDGPGIPLALRDTLFLPFHKFSDTTPGTGLGLAISQGIARQMGGDLVLVPSPVGACFRLTLTVDPAPFGYAAPVPVALPDLAGRCILVVDDIATNRLVAATLVRETGARVIEADSGPAAIASLANHPIDLVLLDINMPGMDGIETLHNIRSLVGPKSRIPVVAMTADALAEHQQRYLADGMDGYISKPLSIIALGTLLRRHLRM